MEYIAIFRMSAMGDVAVSVPIVTAFADQYPEMKITYVMRPLFAPTLVHISSLEMSSLELNGKHTRLYGLYRLCKEPKTKGIDGMADVHNILRTDTLRLYFRGGGASFTQTNKERIEKRALTRCRFKSSHPLRPSYQRYVDVFAILGFSIDLTEDYLLSPPDISETVQRILSETVNIRVIPLASYEEKQYPFEKTCKMIQQLSVQYPNGKIYIFGGEKKEEGKVEQTCLPNAENMVSKSFFRRELEFISRLDIIMAMGSGSAYLSAIYGVPTITIWGITHPYTGFYPYAWSTKNTLLADRTRFPLIPISAYGKKYPRGYDKAIRMITIEATLNRVREVTDKEER